MFFKRLKPVFAAMGLLIVLSAGCASGIRLDRQEETATLPDPDTPQDAGGGNSGGTLVIKGRIVQPTD